MSEQMSDRMPDRIPDRMCQIECQEIRRIECHKICQIKCVNIYAALGITRSKVCLFWLVVSNAIYWLLNVWNIWCRLRNMGWNHGSSTDSWYSPDIGGTTHADHDRHVYQQHQILLHWLHSIRFVFPSMFKLFPSMFKPLSYPKDFGIYCQPWIWFIN